MFAKGIPGEVSVFSSVRYMSTDVPCDQVAVKKMHGPAGRLHLAALLRHASAAGSGDASSTLSSTVSVISTIGAVLT